VFAGRERPNRPLDVQRVRERDVDRVDLGVLEQGFVAPVRPGNAVLHGVGLGPVRIPTRDRYDLGGVGLLGSGEEPAVDPRGREKAPAHLGRAHPLPLWLDGGGKRSWARVRISASCACSAGVPGFSAVATEWSHRSFTSERLYELDRRAAHLDE
jgi:hypothetical protein